jgi:hypothetical protein
MEDDVKIQLALKRTREGVSLEVKTVPAIEEFFRSMGNGNQQSVNYWGKSWQSFDGSELCVWDSQYLVTPSNNRLDILSAGQPLVRSYINDDNKISEVVNMSFLRLVGIGGTNGVKFLIKGMVASTTELEDIRNKLVNAGKQFCVEYLAPCELRGSVMKGRF